jgi:hypothetical protein
VRLAVRCGGWGDWIGVVLDVPLRGSALIVTVEVEGEGEAPSCAVSTPFELSLWGFLAVPHSRTSNGV